MQSQYSNHRRRAFVDDDQINPFKHVRVHSQAGSISSEASTSSTLVESPDVPESFLDDEHVMMHLEHMHPIYEAPEHYIPSAPSSILLPEQPAATPTPASSSHHLLSPSQPAGGSRLWLHRRRHPTVPTPSITVPSTRSSFLTSLWYSRWPKSESEDPIFGQTTPRALSPHRQQHHPDELEQDRSLSKERERPPSTLSAPRSILTRSDSRGKRSLRSVKGSVKFVEKPKLWEYEEYYGEYGRNRDRDLSFERRERWRGGSDEADADDDADSVITLPPPMARDRARSESFLRRFIGSSGKSHARGHGKRVKGKVTGVGEKLVISGPMPLARASSLRDLKDANKVGGKGDFREKNSSMASVDSGAKKENRLRTFWGRLHCGTGVV